MTDNDFDPTYSLLILIGYAASLIHEYRSQRDLSLLPHEQQKKYEWFMDAIKDVVYKNRPIQKECP